MRAQRFRGFELDFDLATLAPGDLLYWMPSTETDDQDGDAAADVLLVLTVKATKDEIEFSSWSLTQGQLEPCARICEWNRHRWEVLSKCTQVTEDFPDGNHFKPQVGDLLRWHPLERGERREYYFVLEIEPPQETWPNGTWFTAWRFYTEEKSKGWVCATDDDGSIGNAHKWFLISRLEQ